MLFIFYFNIIGKAKLEDTENPDWVPSQSMGYILKNKNDVARTVRKLNRCLIKATTNVVTEKVNYVYLCTRSNDI